MQAFLGLIVFGVEMRIPVLVIYDSVLFSMGEVEAALVTQSGPNEKTIPQ
jgi:hypothetical protein